MKFFMRMNFRGCRTTELDKRYLNRRLLMSRPRENPRKFLKKISSVYIGDNVIFALAELH